MPTTTEYAPGQFCWVDLVAHDKAAAETFYCDLFGWTTRSLTPDQGPPYSQFELNGQGVAGVGQMSGEMKSQGVPPMWNSYINVESVEATTKKAQELGATITMPPMQVMEAGWLAFFADPTGGNVGLWQMNQHRGAQITNVPGAFCWNELATRDADKANEFYGQLFGWECVDHPTPNAKYYLIKNNGRDNGGILQMNEQWGEIPPYWAVYFSVADIHKTIDRLKELSGNVHVPPFDTEVGPISVVADPQGGCFSLIQLKNPPK